MSDQVKLRCSKCRKPKEPEEKLLCCGGCRQEFYCSVACQKAAWREHKTCCKFLKETKDGLVADAEDADPADKAAFALRYAITLSTEMARNDPVKAASIGLEAATSAALVSHTFRRKMGQQGSCQMTLMIMKRHPTEARVCTLCIILLSTLALNLENKISIVKEIESIVAIVKGLLEEEKVSQPFCFLIQALSTDEDSGLKLGASGVCEFLMDVMRSHANKLSVITGGKKRISLLQLFYILAYLLPNLP